VTRHGRIPSERYTLDNGLRVVLSPDPGSALVSLNLWYGVGSRNEAPGRTGLAHLFEHMMFQGSEHVPKGGHFEIIERAGGSLNGSTWYDRTNYYETLPAHHLELALWLESDRMGWLLPALTQEKLDNQRDVVKNEKRQRHDDVPYGDWDERMQRLVFPPDHPYHHPVIGSMEDLDAASVADVASFFETFYAPNNAVLTLVGGFDPPQALDLVRRWFGEIPGGRTIPAVPGVLDPGARLGTTIRETVVAQVPLPRVIVAFRIPPRTDPRFHAADVATALLASGRSSRLYRSLVRERRVAKDVVAYAFPLVTGATMMIAWATGISGKSPAELEHALLEEIEGLALVTDEEVARAMALVETSLARSLGRAETRADLLSMFEMQFGDADLANSEMQRLREVTPERIREFGSEFLNDDNLAVLTFEPIAPRAGPAASDAESAA
jgi:zinc protease